MVALETLNEHIRQFDQNEQLLLKHLLSLHEYESFAIEQFEEWLERTPALRYLLFHMFSGAHLVFYDNGELYERLITHVPNLRQRRSSHTSNTQSYAFFGKSSRECLFATRELTDEEKIAHPHASQMTWVQFERSGTHSFWELLKHMIDYLLYLLTKKNIGPLGRSQHTDANPFIVDFQFWPDGHSENPSDFPSNTF